MKIKLLLFFLIGIPFLTYSQYNILLEEKIADNLGGFDQSLTSNDWFGTSVEGIGDLDGDGVEDVAIGAIKDDDGGTDKGAVYIIFLNSDGTVKNHTKIAENTGGFSGLLDTNDIFGSSISYLGDMNNDGFIELAVGAEYDDDGGFNHGAIYILSISNIGMVVSQIKISDTLGPLAGMFQTWEVFGSDVTPLGDLNNDGNPDIAVGARRDSDGGGGRGAVWILYLNSDFTVNSFQKISDTQGNFNGGLSDDDYFGGTVANLGDLDGDGVIDLAVGAYRDNDAGLNIGAVYIIFLNSNGTVKNHQKITEGQAGFTESFNGSNAFFGITVDNAPDINGDNLSEIIVGAPGFLNHNNNRKGALFLLNLNPNGTVDSYEKITEGLQNFTGPLLNDSNFARSVSYIGGLQQTHSVIVGNPKDDFNGNEKGSAWVIQFGEVDTDLVTSINNVVVNCQSRDIQVDYSIYNNGATGSIPINTPFSFYANSYLLSTQYTENNISVGDVVNGTVNLNIPSDVSLNFTLELIGDDDGTGNGIISESDENNNLSSQIIEMGGELNLPESIPDLEVCDDSQNGIQTFDLEAQNSAITINMTNPAETTLAYYASQEDYENGDTIPISNLSSYNNVSNPQTILVEVEGPNGCIATIDFDLVVTSLPEYNTPNLLSICDQDAQDGFATFNLDQATNQITQGYNNLSVRYYEFQVDAEAGNNNTLSLNYTNTMATTQTIYVLIEDINTGCAAVENLTLEVITLPIANEAGPLEVCDYDMNGSAIFDLSSLTNAIEGASAGGVTTTYHATQTDANTATAALPLAYTTETTTIYARVQVNGLTGCYNTVPVILNVLSLPNLSETDSDELRLQECDDDNDGIAINGFDLTQSGALITEGDNTVLSYYTTELAADTGDANVSQYIVNPANYINEPSLNIVNDQGVTVQVIYVRVEHDTENNLCYLIVPIEIQVLEIPILNDVETFGYAICEDSNTGTANITLQNIANNLFDASLNSQDSTILIDLLDQAENSDLDLSNYHISYHFSQIGAETNDEEVPDNYQASTGNEFWVRVVYNATNCQAAIAKVKIIVNSRPDISDTGIILEVCSENQVENIATVDLTEFSEQINPGNPANTQVFYYSNIDDYINDESINIDNLTAYPINTNSQTVIAVVKNTISFCESINFATITVNVVLPPLVDISDYDGTVICRNNNFDNHFEQENYDPIIIDTDLDSDDYIFFWTLDGEELVETGSSITVTSTGEYTVTVKDIFTNCESSSSATFIQGSAPEFDIVPLTLAFSENHSIKVINVPENVNYEFNVDNGAWINYTDDNALVFNDLSAGLHYVYGRDRNGCGITVKELSFIDYPKFFTPNQDGFNDTWNIIGLGQENLEAKIFIFDRYGKLLKQLSPQGPGWDGSFNGKSMPSNDYWFKIEYIQILPTGNQRITQFKGHFTLKR